MISARPINYSLGTIQIVRDTQGGGFNKVSPEIFISSSLYCFGGKTLFLQETQCFEIHNYV